MSQRGGLERRSFNPKAVECVSDEQELMTRHSKSWRTSPPPTITCFSFHDNYSRGNWGPATPAKCKLFGFVVATCQSTDYNFWGIFWLPH
jgi:hypothetical protein